MKELRTLKRMIEERRPSDRPMVIAVDFDGTLCTNEYPNIGEKNELLFELLQDEWRVHATELILWTCRAGYRLEEAYRWMDEEMKEYGVMPPQIWKNENVYRTIERLGGDSRKVFADLYIDDRSMDHDIIWGEEVEEKKEDEPAELEEVTDSDIDEADTILLWASDRVPRNQLAMLHFFLGEVKKKSTRTVKKEDDFSKNVYGIRVFDFPVDLVIVLDPEITPSKALLRNKPSHIKIRKFTI